MSAETMTVDPGWIIEPELPVETRTVAVTGYAVSVMEPPRSFFEGLHDIAEGRIVPMSLALRLPPWLARFFKRA